jgi:hypothetical protein
MTETAENILGPTCFAEQVGSAIEVVSKKDALRAMKEIASLAWEAGREYYNRVEQVYQDTKPLESIPSKEDFIKGLFP